MEGEGEEEGEMREEEKNSCEVWREGKRCARVRSKVGCCGRCWSLPGVPAKLSVPGSSKIIYCELFITGDCYAPYISVLFLNSCCSVLPISRQPGLQDCLNRHAPTLLRIDSPSLGQSTMIYKLTICPM